MYVIRLICRIGGGASEEDGLFVSYFDPDGPAGHAVMWVSPSLERALQFKTRQEIDYLHRNSELKNYNIETLSLISAALPRTFSHKP